MHTTPHMPSDRDLMLPYSMLTRILCRPPKPAALFLRLPLNGVLSGVPDHLAEQRLNEFHQTFAVQEPPTVAPIQAVIAEPAVPIIAEVAVPIIAEPAVPVIAEVAVPMIAELAVPVIDNIEMHDELVDLSDDEMDDIIIDITAAESEDEAEMDFSESCSICWDTGITSGFRCNKSGHVMCVGCTERAVEHTAGKMKKSYVDVNIGVKCGLCDYEQHDFTVFSDEMQQTLSSADSTRRMNIFKRVSDAEIDLLNRQLAEQQHKQQVLEHTEAVRNIFRTFCPICKGHFDGFTACTALTCVMCDTKFCAHCEEVHTVSADLHRHIKQCANNPVQGEYSMSMAIFKAAQNVRMVLKARRYLYDNVVPSVAKQVIDTVKQELRVDLGDAIMY
jgi:hypothetical protein